jgi:hypothetical protein
VVYICFAKLADTGRMGRARKGGAGPRSADIYGPGYGRFTARPWATPPPDGFRSLSDSVLAVNGAARSSVLRRMPGSGSSDKCDARSR